MDSNTFYFGPLILSGSTFQSADTSSAAQYVGELTGSVQGTASYAVVSDVAAVAYQAHTASYALYAISASYEINQETSSSYADFAETASYIALAEQAKGAFTASYTPNAITSVSYNSNALTVTKGNGDAALVMLEDLTALSSSYATTASFATMANTATSASSAESAQVAATSTSASYALTASYALSSAGGGGGATYPEFFTYNFGPRNTTDVWTSIPVTTGPLTTIDNTRDFKIEWQGANYFASDFFGYHFQQTGIMPDSSPNSTAGSKKTLGGMPILVWQDALFNGPGKVAVPYGISHHSYASWDVVGNAYAASYNYEMQLTYDGTNFVWKIRTRNETAGNSSALNGVDWLVRGTITYLS